MSIQEVVLENANLNNGIRLEFGILTTQKWFLFHFLSSLIQFSCKRYSETKNRRNIN